MKHAQLILLFILIFSYKLLLSQCNTTSATMTITGQYTADINPIPGSIVYIAPNSIITGNIYLNNSSLYNCGIILSKKVIMRQSISNNIHVFENNNIISADSIILDSLGHLHNNDSLYANYFQLKNKSDIDNNYVWDAAYLSIESESHFNNLGGVRSIYFNLKGNNSIYYNMAGTISVSKLFFIDTGSFASGFLNICVDSCFINHGYIYNSVQQSYIRVNGISQNTGTISVIDFCDLTSTAGMPDINTGATYSVTYCNTQQYYCNFIYSGIQTYNYETNQVKCYPNPSNGVLTITSNFPQILFIINELGEIVKTIELNSYNNYQTTISDIADGVYCLKDKLSGGVIKNKIVIVR